MLKIRRAVVEDVALILQLVRNLAEYEREPDAVVATEEEAGVSRTRDRQGADGGSGGDCLCQSVLRREVGSARLESAGDRFLRAARRGGAANLASGANHGRSVEKAGGIQRVYLDPTPTPPRM